MGWPFGAKKSAGADPVRDFMARVRDPLDFINMAVQEGGRQAAEGLAGVAPDEWGWDPALNNFALARRNAQDDVIAQRMQDAGASAEVIGGMDPRDFATRQEAFRKASPFNPSSGGMFGWSARNGERMRDWNANAEAAGVAPLAMADAPITDTSTLTAEDRKQRGVMFQRRR